MIYDYDFEQLDIINYVYNNLEGDEKRVFYFLMNVPEAYYKRYKNIHAWGVSVFLNLNYNEVIRIFNKIKHLIIIGE